jgi:hypothetical protein
MIGSPNMLPGGSIEGSGEDPVVKADPASGRE